MASGNTPVFNVPLTVAPHLVAAPTAAFDGLNELKSTRPGAFYEFDAKRGFRVVGLLALASTVAGITAEVASLLAMSAGTDIAHEVEWPITSGAFSWSSCESLPSCDAPATTYGPYLSYIYHCSNIVVLMCMTIFQAKFTARPKATYFISVNGLIEGWLGLGLWSRWVSTFQVTVGAAMLIVGSVLFTTGFTWFWRYVAVEFGYRDTIEDEDVFKKAGTQQVSGKRTKESKGEEDRRLALDYTNRMAGYALPQRKFGS